MMFSTELQDAIVAEAFSREEPPSKFTQFSEILTKFSGLTFSLVGMHDMFKTLPVEVQAYALAHGLQDEDFINKVSDNLKSGENIQFVELCTRMKKLGLTNNENDVEYIHQIPESCIMSHRSTHVDSVHYVILRAADGYGFTFTESVWSTNTTNWHEFTTLDAAVNIAKASALVWDVEFEVYQIETITKRSKMLIC